MYSCILIHGPLMGGDLAPSLGGTDKISRINFSNDLFLGKISILTPKISDDLFLVIARIFVCLYCLKSDI